MKKLFIVLIAMLVSVSAVYGATAKAKATIYAQPSNAGFVFVSKTKIDINNIEGWNSSSSNETTGNSGWGPGEAKVYSYAKADVGYTFYGWSSAPDGNVDNSSNPRETTAKTPLGLGYKDKTVEESFYAQFKPIIVIPEESRNVTLNKKGDTEAQEEVSINLCNAKDFNISIKRTSGGGTRDISCTWGNVTGSGNETPTLTITTAPGVVSGDKFTITITAINGAIGYIYVEVQSDVQVRFLKPETDKGSYTATRADNSGFSVTWSQDAPEHQDVTMTSASQYTYNVVAVAEPGYRFRR